MDKQVLRYGMTQVRMFVLVVLAAWAAACGQLDFTCYPVCTAASGGEYQGRGSTQFEAKSGDEEGECISHYRDDTAQTQACFAGGKVTRCSCEERKTGNPMGRRDEPGPALTASDPLNVRGPGGSRTLLNFSAGGRRTVLYISSSDCVWSGRNESNFAALAASAADRFRVVAVSFDEKDARRLAARLGPGVEVYAGDRAAVMSAYGITGTPTTILISESGVEEEIWTGAYGGQLRRRMERLFAVHLPGLSTWMRSSD